MPARARVTLRRRAGATRLVHRLSKEQSMCICSRSVTRCNRYRSLRVVAHLTVSLCCFGRRVSLLAARLSRVSRSIELRHLEESQKRLFRLRVTLAIVFCSSLN